MSNVIEIVDFSFHYNNNFVLDVKNFYINQGEMVFLSGESGSGKTTLLNIITGILEYKTGSVKVLNTELKLLSNHQRDRFRGQNIGFIFQQFNLIPYLSVKENVLLPCKFFNKDTKLLEKLLHDIDLNEKLWNTRVDELSVGQQQRVACVRALIGSPKLIIADEPTSALDDARQDAFLDMLIRGCKSVNSTLLFVSHNKNLIKRFDRVVQIKDGVVSGVIL
ncbi:MAG: ABC transporter ATP-binding protein [Rickettsiales bacterium]|nr:MAG: ABC transporter ATP-binding protein [Rickettsiales bacterium]